MAGRKYERVDIETFGKHLLDSGDLDPIYIALHKARECRDMLDPQLKRWLVAYWCLYHAGAASYLSEFEGNAFWLELGKAARNDEPAPTGERWPRGHERRHWRGEAARKACRTMAGMYPDAPEDIVHTIIRSPDMGPLPFSTIAERAQKLPLFGPWISFKVADMTDRVLGCKVEFDNNAVFMFKDPTEAALKLWRVKAGLNENAMPRFKDKAIQDVVDYLTHHFRLYNAPPLGDRPVGLQEVETILCKWKSHMNGHYPFYNDIIEIREGLQLWKTSSDTARHFLAAMPKGPSKHV